MSQHHEDGMTEERFRTYLGAKMDQLNAALRAGDGEALSKLLTSFESEGHEQIGEAIEQSLLAHAMRCAADHADPFRPCNHGRMTAEDKFARATRQLLELEQTLEATDEGTVTTAQREALMDATAAARALSKALERGRAAGE
jgi:hypothetical protein